MALPDHSFVFSRGFGSHLIYLKLLTFILFNEMKAEFIFGREKEAKGGGKFSALPDTKLDTPLPVVEIRSEPSKGTGKRVVTFVAHLTRVDKDVKYGEPTPVSRANYLYIEREKASFSWLEKVISLLREKLEERSDELISPEFDFIGMGYKDEIEIRKGNQLAVLNKREGMVHHSKPISGPHEDKYYSQIQEWKASKDQDQ